MTNIDENNEKMTMTGTLELSNGNRFLWII